MKKYLTVGVIIGFCFSLSMVSATSVAVPLTTAVIGDVAPDQASEGCTNLSYNLVYKKSKDANTNGEVSDLQYFLQDQGLLTAEPNGVFGPATLKAVKYFQKKSGFITSGYVGPMTRAKIKEISCNQNTDTVSSTNQETTGGKVCKAIGTKSEGWYDSVTNELIEYANCSYLSNLNIVKMGTLRVYSEINTPSVLTKENVSKDDASKGCKEWIYSNLNKQVRCTWNDVEFYDTFGKDLISNPDYNKKSSPPTITSVIQNGDTIQVYGDRLNLFGNILNIDGSGNSDIDKYKPTSNLLTLDTKKWAIVNELSEGYHKISISNLINGDSNTVSFYFKEKPQVSGDTFSTFGPGTGAVLFWRKSNFTTQNNKKECLGDRYIGYSSRYAVYVGAELCGSNEKYKLYMSDSENGTYYQIADTGGHGQDHCELVNSNFTIPNDDEITSGTCKNCSLGEMFDVQNEPVYVRSKIGENFKKAQSTFWADLTTKSYSCGVSIGDNTLVTPTAPITKIEAHGPNYNAMSCSSPSKSGLPTGSVACYGIWDYGNEFGGDPDMCPPYGYSSLQTGCKVQTKACLSGQAVATRVVKPISMDINSSEMITFATNLRSSKEAVKQQIPTLWEYTCEGVTTSAIKPVVEIYKTAGLVSRNVSAGSNKVKIGSYTITSNQADIIIDKIDINVSVSGYDISNISNLTLKSGETILGMAIGNPKNDVNSFILSKMVVPMGSLKTFDVYADIGSAITGSVTTGIVVYDDSTKNQPDPIAQLNQGVITTSIDTVLANPNLSAISPVSQNVSGGTSMNIATFNLKTVLLGTSATVRELRFKTTGTDAIVSIKVNDVTAPVVVDTATITGLSIPISSSGVNVPVTVNYSGFQNSTTGGSLTQNVPNVSVSLNYVEAVTTSGKVITNTTSVSSNIMNLVNPSQSQVSLISNTPKVLGANTTCVDIPRNLHRGAESSSVTILQKFLQSKGLLSEISGFYGDKTIEAVKDYQGSKGLVPTGMVYEVTRQAVRDETCQ